MIVQQQYDDEPVTIFHMAEVNQEVTGILPILPLLLEGQLGIGIEGCEWDAGLDIIVSTKVDNYLEEIDKYWIQLAKDYDTKNEHYKDEDRGGYAINV